VNEVIPGLGGSITVTGESNASALTFSITGTGFSISGPQISTDSGRTWKDITSGTAIKGDPGAAAKYLWRITATATSSGTSSRTGTLSVGGEKLSINIALTQAAAVSKA
jgi:hypothetical protein